MGVDKEWNKDFWIGDVRIIYLIRIFKLEIKINYIE